ncbi:nuclear transport factor 2 family protein [Natrialbaceae archaeon A-gly3]
MTDAACLVKRYYEALDDGEYGDLEGILAPGFVQHRPDRTFESRREFVAFMREGRPNTDTRHELRDLEVDGREVIVHGRLFDADGTELFVFVDRFTLAEGRIVHLETAVDE